MKVAQQAHADMLAALREKTFERLVIKRLDSTCYLVIAYEGKAHVFGDSNGKRIEYRHAWQVRDWLQESFDIPPESVPVERIRR
jgi:hypothetical protein